MTLVALSNMAWGALLTLLILSGAWKKLPGPPKLARATIAALALGLASNALLILLSEDGDWTSEVAERVLFLVDGLAFVSAGCFAGLYVMQLGSLATNRKDMSQTAIDLTVATGRWTGLFLICISLAFVPIILVLVVKPP